MQASSQSGIPLAGARAVDVVAAPAPAPLGSASWIRGIRRADGGCAAPCRPPTQTDGSREEMGIQRHVGACHTLNTGAWGKEAGPTVEQRHVHPHVDLRRRHGFLHRRHGSICSSRPPRGFSILSSAHQQLVNPSPRMSPLPRPLGLRTLAPDLAGEATASGGRRRRRNGEVRAVTVWGEHRRSGVGAVARRDPEGGSEGGGGGGGERERVRALGFATQGESGVVCGGWVRP